jgi:hypothetical protein
MEWHVMMYLLSAEYPLHLLVVGVDAFVNGGLRVIGESDQA